MNNTITNTKVTEQEFANISDVPSSIDDDQFYCYNPKTGTIRIGTIVGKSALTDITIYKLGQIEFKEHRLLSKKDPIATFRINPFIKNVKAFINYADLLKKYNEDFLSKLKKKKEQKTRYIVSTDTFVCKMTRAAYIPHGFKTFTSKDEAVDYANKGLKSVKAKLEKYIPMLKDFQKTLLMIEGNCVEDTSFKNLMVTPNNITEKDLLTKIAYKKYKTQFLPEIDESYVTRVAEFITPELAKLNDGTLLDKKECYCSDSYNTFPMFIKYDSTNEAKEKLKTIITKRLLDSIKYKLPNLEKLQIFVEKYEPLKKIYGMTTLYFHEHYLKQLIEDLNEAIPKLKEL